MAGTYIEIGYGAGGGGSSGPDAFTHSVATAGSLPVVGDEDGQLIYVRDTESIYAWDGTGLVWEQILNGLADVSGPGGATDNRFARFDGATGKLIQSSVVNCDDTGNVSGVQDLDMAGTLNTALTADRVMVTTTGGVVTVAGALTPTGLVRANASGIPETVAGATMDASANASFNSVSVVLPMVMPNLTTVARDALTPAQGMVIYNTTVDLFQGYSAGAWVNLHGWGA
jgi:hypothetical protein